MMVSPGPEAPGRPPESDSVSDRQAESDRTVTDSAAPAAAPASLVGLPYGTTVQASCGRSFTVGTVTPSDSPYRSQQNWDPDPTVAISNASSLAPLGLRHTTVKIDPGVLVVRF